MDPTQFRQHVQNDDTMLGMGIQYPAESIIESIGHMWDFLWLDGQHGQISYERMLSMVRTADLVGVDTVVRVPGHESGTLGLYADMAPSAIMVPMINTAEDARAAVEAVRFPPLGSRSFGGRRPIDTMGRTYYLEKEPLLIAQIETRQAIENCEEIASTDGVDLLMLGPDDLKTQLGLAIDSPLLDTPELLQCLNKVVRAADKAGKGAMCIATTPELLKYAYGLGYRIFIGSSDVYLLRQGSQESARKLRGAVDSESSVTVENNVKVHV
ncbi:MAG: hypothetical protein JXM70_30580 [Pirellulales bacterium]|nr:hypothetical protein [Pirellulales bacterium]